MGRAPEPALVVHGKHNQDATPPGAEGLGPGQHLVHHHGHPLQSHQLAGKKCLCQREALLEKDVQFHGQSFHDTPALPPPPRTASHRLLSDVGWPEPSGSMLIVECSLAVTSHPSTVTHSIARSWSEPRPNSLLQGQWPLNKYAPDECI